MGDDERATCHYCDRAPARTLRLGQPACNECGEAISAFYRGERFALALAVTEKIQAAHAAKGT